jgi:lysophospholipase L1-like esterase
MVAGQVFPKNNEGHSGWTISQVASVVPSPALSTPPHIVLLHVGTNDAYMGSGQSTMGDRLGSLIDKVAGAVPDALIVVAKIVPMSNASWNAIIKTYNDGIPAVVQKRVDMGKHVTVIDLNTGFMPSMLSSDGVHPNKSGYDFMGDKWYAAISAVLP